MIRINEELQKLFDYHALGITYRNSVSDLLIQLYSELMRVPDSEKKWVINKFIKEIKERKVYE